jgi:hypothetical protein
MRLHVQTMLLPTLLIPLPGPSESHGGHVKTCMLKPQILPYPDAEGARGVPDAPEVPRPCNPHPHLAP